MLLQFEKKKIIISYSNYDLQKFRMNHCSIKYGMLEIDSCNDVFLVLLIYILVLH
jgi:hypothetical protein